VYGILRVPNRPVPHKTFSVVGPTFWKRLPGILQYQLLTPQCRGIHPSEALMHYLRVSNFPLFPRKFSDSVENFFNFTFSQDIFLFSSDKISYDFFSSLTKNFEFPPIFAVSVHFPPISGKLLFPSVLFP